MSDSHTAFHSGSFTAGAVGGAMTIAGALVGGLQALAQASREAAARWTRDQLEKAYVLSELLRFEEHDKCLELERQNAELRAVIQSMTVRPLRTR